MNTFPKQLSDTPLSEEEKNKFKVLETITLNDFQRKFWEKQIETLLKDTIHPNKKRMEYVIRGRECLSPYFETIASWDFPNMDKGIMRDEDGYIEYIVYSTFFYLFGSEKYIVSGMKKLLERLPRFYLDTLEQMYIEEKKFNKNEKITQIARNNIPFVVKTLVKQLGLPYVLEEQKTTTLLKIKINDNYYLEFSLPYKTFVKRIDKIVSTLCRAKYI